LGLFFSVSEKAPIRLPVRQKRLQRAEEIMVTLFEYWVIPRGTEVFQSYF
jgi:hypothetical protein